MVKVKTPVKIASHLVLVLFTAAALFPILFPLFSSFRTDFEIFEYAAPFTLNTLLPVEWTLDNYLSLFRDYNFQRYILNTLLVVGVTVPVSVFMCSLAAYAFAFYDFKGKNALFALFLLSFMIPGEAIALPLYQISERMGLVNTYGGLILPALANGLVLFMFVQSFRDVPKSLLEAVKIDGGSWWTSYWRVVMPLSKTIILTACLMIFVNEWNNYLWPLLVARRDEVRTLTIAISSFKEENVTRWSLIYASSMLSALVPVCLFFSVPKVLRAGHRQQWRERVGVSKTRILLLQDIMACGLLFRLFSLMSVPAFYAVQAVRTFIACLPLNTAASRPHIAKRRQSGSRAVGLSNILNRAVKRRRRGETQKE